MKKFSSFVSEEKQPLPKKWNDGYAVYDIPSGDSVNVRRHRDGSFVVDHPQYDKKFKTENEVKAELKKIKARYAGWEFDDE